MSTPLLPINIGTDEEEGAPGAVESKQGEREGSLAQAELEVGALNALHELAGGFLPTTPSNVGIGLGSAPLGRAEGCLRGGSGVLVSHLRACLPDCRLRLLLHAMPALAPVNRRLLGG